MVERRSNYETEGQGKDTHPFVHHTKDHSVQLALCSQTFPMVAEELGEEARAEESEWIHF